MVVERTCWSWLQNFSFADSALLSCHDFPT